MLDRLSIKYFKLAVGINAIGKETDVDIAARCPVCGDSRRNASTKRLHLYNKGMIETDLVHCFNGDCPVQNKPIYRFLNDHYPELLNGYKRERFHQNMNTLSDVFGKKQNDLEQETLDYDWTLTEPVGSVESVGSNEPEDPLENSDYLNSDDWFGSQGIVPAPLDSDLDSLLKEDTVKTIALEKFLTPIENSQEAMDYIKSRGLKYLGSDGNPKYGKFFYGHQDLEIDDTLYRITNNIIIPLYYGDKMYGFYARNISNKFFCTFMQDVNTGYKIWNWFRIDKNEPVYIFEGIFDAISSGLDNVIALMGAKIPPERLNELKNPVFVLDNDITGLKNSLDYSKKYSVYIQPQKYKEKDMNDLRLNNPELCIPELIRSNTYKGIMAEVQIRSKL